MYHSGAIIQLVFKLDRQAHRCEQVQALGGLQDRGQPLLGSAKQSVLQKQVAAGVAGQAQLRQAQHPHALFVRLPHQAKDLLGVVTAVGYPDLGRTGGGFDKSIPHMKNLPWDWLVCSPLSYPKQGGNASGIDGEFEFALASPSRGKVAREA